MWDNLGSPTPSFQLVGDDLAQFLRTLKCWDAGIPLRLNFGLIQPARIHVLVTGSVYLIGDVLSVSPTSIFAIVRN